MIQKLTDRGMNVKVGILTFIGTNNYGAVLQAYALNRKIRDMGYDCETIRYYCDRIVQKESPPRLADVKGLKEKLAYWLANPGLRRKYREMQAFLAKNAPVSRDTYSRKNIAETDSIYDKFIVGSDIIWETNVTGNDFSYYLDFVTDPAKKFSYAGSFGYDQFPEAVAADCTALLDAFSRISVREQQGQRLIAEVLTGKQADLVCDPTLLLTGEQWEEFANGPIKLKKEEYIFLYFLDSKGVLLSRARELAQQYGKKIVVYNEWIKPIPGAISVRNLTMQQFLAYIKNSFFVLSASYHAACFSILFRRDFAFFNRAHASRILSLVSELGITDRNLAENPAAGIGMDYDSLQPKLEAFREKSEKYLSDILTDQESK